MGHMGHMGPCGSGFTRDNDGEFTDVIAAVRRPDEPAPTVIAFRHPISSLPDHQPVALCATCKKY